MRLIQNTFIYKCVGVPPGKNTLPLLVACELQKFVSKRKREWKLRFLYTGIN